MNLPVEFKERLDFFKNTLKFSVDTERTNKDTGEIVLWFFDGICITVEPCDTTLEEVVQKVLQAGYEQGYDEGCQQQEGIYT